MPGGFGGYYARGPSRWFDLCPRALCIDKEVLRLTVPLPTRHLGNDELEEERFEPPPTALLVVVPTPSPKEGGILCRKSNPSPSGGGRRRASRRGWRL